MSARACHNDALLHLPVTACISFLPLVSSCISYQYTTTTTLLAARLHHYYHSCISMPSMSQIILDGGLASAIARITPEFFSVTSTCLIEVNEDIINVSNCRLAGVPNRLKLLSEVLCYLVILFGMFLTCAIWIMTVICVCVLYQRLRHGKNSRISGDDKLPKYAGKTRG